MRSKQYGYAVIDTDISIVKLEGSDQACADLQRLRPPHIQFILGLLVGKMPIMDSKMVEVS